MFNLLTVFNIFNTSRLNLLNSNWSPLNTRLLFSETTFTSQGNIIEQQPGSTQMESIIDFHHDLMTFIVFIVFFVVYGLIFVWYQSDWRHPSLFVGSWDHQFTHFPYLEIVWTLIPMLILLSIGGPSFALLYSVEDVMQCNLTLKVIGAQWYWIYEYSDAFWGNNPITIESRLVDDDTLLLGESRLLAVDNPVLLPADTRIRFLITSIDVIHSWAVPALGIKLDACPGRLNETFSFILYEGHYYGQCSEICGINHGFMPIHIVSVDADYFADTQVPEIVEVVALNGSQISFSENPVSFKMGFSLFLILSILGEETPKMVNGVLDLRYTYTQSEIWQAAITRVSTELLWEKLSIGDSHPCDRFYGWSCYEDEIDWESEEIIEEYHFLKLTKEIKEFDCEPYTLCMVDLYKQYLECCKTCYWPQHEGYTAFNFYLRVIWWWFNFNWNGARAQGGYTGSGIPYEIDKEERYVDYLFDNDLLEDVEDLDEEKKKEGVELTDEEAAIAEAKYDFEEMLYELAIDW